MEKHKKDINHLIGSNQLDKSVCNGPNRDMLTVDIVDNYFVMYIPNNVYYMEDIIWYWLLGMFQQDIPVHIDSQLRNTHWHIKYS
jgi:hypothetical protein